MSLKVYAIVGIMAFGAGAGYMKIQNDHEIDTAVVNQKLKDEKTIADLKEKADKREVRYVERIKTIHQAVDPSMCLDQRMPDAVLCGLHYTGADAPRCPPDG